MPMSKPLLLLLLALAALFVTPARAAQSYDNCAGYIDTLPATIATQGVWCLRHDLSTSITTGAAITIAANNVTVDCNDFKIGGLAAGAQSSAKGIVANSRLNGVVRNCNVRGFQYGLFFSGGGHLVEHNRFDQNLFVGIYVIGDNNRVIHNAIYDTGGGVLIPGSAIGVFAEADTTDNIVSGVFAVAATASTTGLHIGGVGSQAINNNIRGLTFAGGGYATGIDVYAADITIAENRISSVTATSGRGVFGYAATTCARNVISRFAVPTYDCIDAGGNSSH